MAYILPRAVIVLTGWAITCVLIHNLSVHVGSMAFYLAAISWAVAGVACFGYLHRLRTELQEPHGRP